MLKQRGFPGFSNKKPAIHSFADVIGLGFSHHPGTAQEKGARLGLTMCKEMVEHNGGKIWVKNPPLKYGGFLNAQWGFS